MQLQTDKLPGSQLDLKFSLSKEDVQQAFNKVYTELAQGGSVPGFRPGKAPASLIKRRFKPEMLRDMFWMKAVETFVEPELQKEELEVIGDPDFPDFSEIEVSEDAGVDFAIKVTVRPVPELPDYSGNKLYRIDATVSDEKVAEVIEGMRSAAAKEVAVEDRETVEDGDLVEAEVSVSLEGEEEPKHTSTQTFEIGSGRYTPAIDQEMLGKKIGDVVEVANDYPEDHPDEELRGQKGTIKATIKSLKIKVLPELDDEFAKAQGEYENLEDLQAKMREKLEKDAATESRQTLENDALSAVVKDTKIDMPNSLVDSVARRGYQSFLQDLKSEGLSIDQFKEIANVDEQTLQANEWVRASITLKVELTLDAIAKAEGIEVDEAAMDEEVTAFAAENNLEESFIKQTLEIQEDFREQLENRAQRRLTLAALMAKAEIEDVTRERYDEIKAEEKKAEEEKAAAIKAEAEAAAAAAAAEAEKLDEAPAEEAAAEAPAEEPTEAPAAEAETEEAAAEPKDEA
ncbi:MAG: trigger factor [Armatimonadota bacterium]